MHDAKELFSYYSVRHFTSEPANPTVFAILRSEDLAEPNGLCYLVLARCGRDVWCVTELSPGC